MAGLQKEGFECKIKHFAERWKYAEGQVVSQFEFQQWAEGRHSPRRLELRPCAISTR
jgi:hypothetical protein